MLQTHFAHRDDEGINLFPLIVDVLLREVEFPTTGATFGDEWAAIQEMGGKWLDLAVRDVARMDDAEKIPTDSSLPIQRTIPKTAPPTTRALPFKHMWQPNCSLSRRASRASIMR